MYPGIELRLYRYVSVLAEELNFTQAAQRLYVSQPTLSTQIRDLDREINVKLFERTRGGQQVVLTAAGQAFATEARLALVHADRAVQEARAADGLHTGTWNLGYSPLVDLRIVSKVRQYLSEAYPATFKLSSPEITPKLIWPVSLDGKKMQSETYKVLGILDKPKSN
jgi:DNA-binding transcriptional LysR family regulator